jgi:hypothetical protein
VRGLRTVLMALLVITSLTLLCSSADKKQLAAALAAVDANLKTPSGKQYDADCGKDLRKFFPNLRTCKQVGAPSDFDMFLHLQGDGKVQEALVYPETPFANCARDALLNGKFSRPPHGDYWVNVHMQFRK